MPEKKRQRRRWNPIRKIRLPRPRFKEDKGLNTTTFTQDDEDEEYEIVDDVSFSSLSSYTVETTRPSTGSQKENNSQIHQMRTTLMKERHIVVEPPVQDPVSKYCLLHCNTEERVRSDKKQSHPHQSHSQRSLRIVAVDGRSRPKDSELDTESMERMPTDRVANTNNNTLSPRSPNKPCASSKEESSPTSSLLWGFGALQLQCAGYGQSAKEAETVTAEANYWFQGSPVLDGETLPHCEETTIQAENMNWRASSIKTSLSDNSSLFDGTLDSSTDGTALTT